LPNTPQHTWAAYEPVVAHILPIHSRSVARQKDRSLARLLILFTHSGCLWQFLRIASDINSTPEQLRQRPE
jgi:hypothetical protein